MDASTLPAMSSNGLAEPSEPALAGDVARLDFVSRPQLYPQLWRKLVAR